MHLIADYLNKMSRPIAKSSIQLKKQKQQANSKKKGRKQNEIKCWGKGGQKKGRNKEGRRGRKKERKKNERIERKNEGYKDGKTDRRKEVQVMNEKLIKK